MAARKFFRRLIRKPRKNHVFHFPRLLRNRRGNFWIRVPVKIHPPRRNRIENFSPVFRVQPHPFSVLDFNRRRIERRVREWMPDLKGG